MSAPSARPSTAFASDAMQSFVDDLQRVAVSDATVLFSGESGAGKGVAARMLHAASKRSAGPLVQADLAGLTPTLVESTLFGHERGAFTDAHRARTGLFRRADGGSLVLDDIDLLPLEAQVKLLRVLQERVVEPLGAETPVPVDVRVIATTNADLEREIEAGRFREDLYWRLAVVTLAVPPLRARRADLPTLCEVLLERVAERSGVPLRSLGPGALEVLAEHPWPGNVRELENALERVLVLGGAGPIAPEEFDFLAESGRGMAEEVAAAALGHGLTVEEVTLAMMERALEEQRGNVSAAARQVGLTRRAFDYRIGKPSSASAPEEGE